MKTKAFVTRSQHGRQQNRETNRRDVGVMSKAGKKEKAKMGTKIGLRGFLPLFRKSMDQQPKPYPVTGGFLGVLTKFFCASPFSYFFSFFGTVSITSAMKGRENCWRFLKLLHILDSSHHHSRFLVPR